MSRSDRGDRERRHGEAVTDEGTGFGLRSLYAGDFAACGRRVTLPTAARRRKVRLSPFPPSGENCDRFLAPPLPGEPAALGFAGSTGEITQNAPGTAPDEHFVLIVAHPTPSGPSGHLPLTGGVGPGPHLRGLPLEPGKNFRRAKSEWLSAISSGPLGPGFLENWSWCGSTTAPGVAEPTCLVRNTGYLIRPLRGHLPLKGKALEGPSPCLPL